MLAWMSCQAAAQPPALTSNHPLWTQCDTPPLVLQQDSSRQSSSLGGVAIEAPRKSVGSQQQPIQAGSTSGSLFPSQTPVGSLGNAPPSPQRLKPEEAPSSNAWGVRPLSMHYQTLSNLRADALGIKSMRQLHSTVVPCLHTPPSDALGSWWFGVAAWPGFGSSVSELWRCHSPH